MIDTVVIKGYRSFRDLQFAPKPRLNIIVGDNEAGKSTVLEAIALALTGRINGRWAADELNPFWFNQDLVSEYFAKHGTAEEVPPPTIDIEVYFNSSDPQVQKLRGIHNTLQRKDAPGLRLRVQPAKDFAPDFAEYMAGDHPPILPTEFYEVVWKDFNDLPLPRQVKGLGVSFIDSRTIRSSSGVDYHTRQILGSFLDPKERAQIAVAHRKARHQITEESLGSVNEKIAADSEHLHDQTLGLAMDQSARASWESGVVPQVEDIPFALIGQGQQASIKVALAMRRKENAKFVLIEEPETHLSYSRLQKLIERIDALASEDQQLFVTTHSSYVLNRLGIDRLLLLAEAGVSRISDLTDETVRYFQHLSGYDTMRLVLGNQLVLVEGPSDEMIFARAFCDTYGMYPHEAGIDVVSMSGVTFARALELCARLDRPVVALQDNDGSQPADIIDGLSEYLSETRQMYVGEPSLGSTLEPQLIEANSVDRMREVLGLRKHDNPVTWMPNHKTEAALRILESEESINFPPYILDAVEQFK